MIINRVVFWLFSITIVIGIFGCSSQVHVDPDTPICLSYSNQADLMAVCEDVLVRMNFEIEKYDVDRGYIKTRPLRGAQFFEFWRSDNAGSANASTSNLHSVLRTIELQLTDDNGGFCVECTSQLRRLSIPEPKLSSTSINNGIFTGGSRTLQKLRPKQRNLDWIEMGSDTKLEQKILGRILAKIEKR
jgi:hypothetical protein